MKVAVSSMSNTLDSQVDPRFGRCQYILIADTDTMEFKAIQNTNIGAAHGAGIGTSQMVANEGAEVVITGNVGPNAFQTLSSFGLKVFVGASGTVREAVEAYKSGRLTDASSPTVGGHYGTGMSMGGGAGMGMGGGRGMGRGGGMGMGGGGFTPQAGPAQATPPAGMTKEGELEMLKEQAQTLSQQVEEINRRIEGLQKADDY